MAKKKRKKIRKFRTRMVLKRIGDLNVRAIYHVSITRIRRAGVELLATRDLRLQLGDRITVVGEERAVDKVEKLFGNSTKRLDVPNLASIFLGLALGVAAGLVPIMLPGLGQPFKLGIAGGSLIAAILMSSFGPKIHIITYTTSSANLMIREIGIAMFLAAVGFGAGNCHVFASDDESVVGRIWIDVGFYFCDFFYIDIECNLATRDSAVAIFIHSSYIIDVCSTWALLPMTAMLTIQTLTSTSES